MWECGVLGVGGHCFCPFGFGCGCGMAGVRFAMGMIQSDLLPNILQIRIVMFCVLTRCCRGYMPSTDYCFGATGNHNITNPTKYLKFSKNRRGNDTDNFDKQR